MNWKRTGAIAAAIVVVGEFALLASGNRILLSETRVPRYSEAGDSMFAVVEPQLLGETLHCKYFTGRGFITSEFNYAANNDGGWDQCPFLYNPDGGPR